MMLPESCRILNDSAGRSWNAKSKNVVHIALPGSPSSDVNQERSGASILPVMTDGEALSGSGDKTSMTFKVSLACPSGQT